jgi:K+-transporting ATPase KdpF subunit
LAASDSCSSGRSQKHATASRRSSMFDYVISGVVALFLLVYLGWAMFKPERF